MKINMFSSAHRSAKASRQGGFTLIELLVVIAIISILAAFAVPALTSALKKGQMTGTMNNARQLYIAQFQMSNDGAATGDAGSAWPGDLIAATLLAPVTLNAYTDYLVAKGYLQGGDAAIFKEGQAVDAPPQWPDDITFQTTVGFKTGDTYGGVPTAGEPANVLTYP